MLPKIDLIRAESEAYDIAVYTESWLKPSTSNDDISIENFLPPFRTDRPDRPGGGVVICVRDTILCKRRKDIEINGLEAVWLEVIIKSKKILIGGIYRPPNSSSDYFNLMLESIDRAHNTHIYDIIITGDFNYDMLSNGSNKMTDLLQQYNLTQLIAEETHFTEQSASLIDLIIVRNKNNILTSGVADPFVPNLTRYHCPVFVLLKFIRPKAGTYKRKIWNYQRADFGKFRQILSEQDLASQVRQNDLDTSVQIMTDAIFSAAEQSIPNRVVTIRPNDYPWIISYIKTQIRRRRRKYNKFMKTKSLHIWNQFKTLRNGVIELIRRSKQDYFDKLENTLTDASPNSKVFWKMSKQLLTLQKTSQSIPTLTLNNEYAETDLQKADMLNKYFASQSVVDDRNPATSKTCTF